MSNLLKQIIHAICLFLQYFHFANSCNLVSSFFHLHLFFVVRKQGAKINDAACKIAREVANEGDALVAGGISQTPTYLTTQDKAQVQEVFRKQMKVFVENNVDFMIAEVSELRGQSPV